MFESQTKAESGVHLCKEMKLRFEFDFALRLAIERTLFACKFNQFCVVKLFRAASKEAKQTRPVQFCSAVFALQR